MFGLIFWAFYFQVWFEINICRIKFGMIDGRELVGGDLGLSRMIEKLVQPRYEKARRETSMCYEFRG